MKCRGATPRFTLSVYIVMHVRTCSVLETCLRYQSQARRLMSVGIANGGMSTAARVEADGNVEWRYGTVP
jgi:hypothetical protein